MSKDELRQIIEWLKQERRGTQRTSGGYRRGKLAELDVMMAEAKAAIGIETLIEDWSERGEVLKREHRYESHLGKYALGCLYLDAVKFIESLEGNH